MTYFSDKNLFFIYPIAICLMENKRLCILLNLTHIQPLLSLPQNQYPIPCRLDDSDLDGWYSNFILNILEWPLLKLIILRLSIVPSFYLCNHNLKWNTSSKWWIIQFSSLKNDVLQRFWMCQPTNTQMWWRNIFLQRWWCGFSVGLPHKTPVEIISNKT